ncbi:hypothetical protein ASG07_07000 [Sphingomonas sp. Leaf343]|nr:hypothetical protein ASG07_07000 [Sphingomonas sp. Leaf343]
MRPHARIIVDLAVEILLSAKGEARLGRVDTVAVRLALRCLLAHCPERWPLASFWEAAGEETELNRTQGVSAAFNGILRQLRRSGAYPEYNPAEYADPDPARAATNRGRIADE